MTTEPLRDRLPYYARWFGVEVGAAAIISLVVWWLADMSWPQAFGVSLVGIGLLPLLAGGMSGGGYTTAGRYGVLFGKRHDQGWDSTAGEIARAQDLRDRLRDRLRPAPNPTALRRDAWTPRRIR